MKRIFLGLFIIMLLVLSSLIACAPAPASTTVPNATQSLQKTNTVYELKVAVTSPPMAPPAAAITQWAKKMESVSEGRLKFTIYYSSALFEARECLPSMLAQVADISDFWIDAAPGTTVLNTFPALPFSGWSDPYTSTVIYRSMFNKVPELTAELKGLKVLYPVIAAESTGYLHTTNKSIKNAGDFKGMKFIAVGYSAKWQNEMGATPVNIPYEDTFSSLEKGLINGHFQTYGWMFGSGSAELTPYHTVIGSQCNVICQILVMNPNSWNKLPADLQKLFTDTDEFYTNTRIRAELDAETAGLKLGKAKAHTFYNLPPEELALWKASAEKVHLDWIKQNGPNAKKVYDEFKKLLASTPRQTPPPTQESSKPESKPAGSSAVIPGVKEWKQALELTDFGSTVTVSGTVLDVKSFMPPEKIIFIGDVGTNPMSGFTLVISDPSKGFPDLDSLKSKNVEASGILAKNSFTGKAQLNISSPDQIKVK